jgi:predicted phage-related endonuclease
MQDSVKQDRELYIGGSDIPVIMEISPFKSRYDLLLEKAGIKEDTFSGNIYTEYGNVMEPKIREYINRSFKEPFRFKEGKHVREAKGDDPIGVRCHTDGENCETVLEIKTTSQIFDNVDEYKVYLVQLLYYMVETNKTNGLLAVYERPEDLSEDFDPARLHRYTIEIKQYEDLIQDIASAIARFMEDLKKVKENPFISEEELLPAEIPDITSRILAFEYQLQQMKEVEEKIKSEKARLKAAMEAASVKSWTTPNGYKITLVPDGEDKVVTEEILNTDRLKSEAPEIYLKFTEEKKVTKKGRAGYIKITAPKDKEG